MDFVTEPLVAFWEWLAVLPILIGGATAGFIWWISGYLAYMLYRINLFPMLNAWAINLTKGIWENNLLRRSLNENRLVALILPRNWAGLRSWALDLTYRLRVYRKEFEGMKIPTVGHFAMTHAAALHIRKEFKTQLDTVKKGLDLFNEQVDIYVHAITRVQEETRHQTELLQYKTDRGEDLLHTYDRRYWRLVKKLLQRKDMRATYREMRRLKKKRDTLRRHFIKRKKRMQTIEQQIFLSYDDLLIETGKQIIRIDERYLREPIHELVMSAEVFRSFATAGRVFNILADKNHHESVRLRDHMKIPAECPWGISEVKAFMLAYLGSEAPFGPEPPREDILEHYLRKLHATEYPNGDYPLAFLASMVPAGTHGLAMPHYHQDAPKPGYAKLKTQPARRRSKTATPKPDRAG